MSAVTPLQQERRLRVIEATETVNVKHPIFLIFGQPGVCKTSLGFSAENPLLLNFDTESAIARAVNRGPSMNVLTIEELEELEAGTDLLDPYDTITIDTVGACVNLVAAAMIKRNPKMGRDGSPTQQGWGVLRNRFRAWMTALRARDKNILLIAHHKEDKNGDTVFVRPDIPGGSKDEVMRLADFVGFVQMRGKDRVLDFNPTEAWFGKNPAQWPEWHVPSPEKARTFMAQLFQKGRDALSGISNASAEAANLVLDWKAKIETLRTAEELNAQIPLIKALPAGVYPQVATMLVNHGKSLGFAYDKASTAFIARAGQGDPL